MSTLAWLGLFAAADPMPTPLLMLWNPTPRSPRRQSSQWALGLLSAVLALLSAAAGPALALSASQRPGDTGPSIRQLQQQLRSTGHYRATAVGSFDGRTAAALRAFQQQRGLFPKGEVDVATKQQLLDATGDDRQGSLTADLQSGDQGPSVRELQTLLRRSGHFSGSVSGWFGPQTRTALEGFQRSRGLRVTGQVDLGTMQQLRTLSVGQVPSRPTTPTRPTGTLLRPGSSGAAVRELQTRLTSGGWFRATIDGRYGPLTTNAVRAFQRSRGLSVDGIAGPRTLAALTGSVPSQPNRPPTPTTTLVPGQRSLVVSQLQQKLKDLGFFRAGVTGYYGAITTSAVRAFQRSRRLPPTGVVGPATWQALGLTTATPSVPISPSNPTNPSNDAAYTNLSLGARGDRVRTLQARLTEYGLLAGGRETGLFGAATEAAVRAFQRSRGLPANGIADLKTQVALGL